LSPRSSQPDARATALRWSGPVLAALGLVTIAALALLPAAKENPLARWLLTETLAPAHVLPLIGLGVAFALVGVRLFTAALVLFAFGIAGGLRGEYWLLWTLDLIPGAAMHLFVTDPIAYLAAGVALIAGTRWRTYVAPVAAIVVGATLALTIRLTDPSLHALAFTFAPVLAAFWIVTAVSLTLRAFRRGWFPIFGRILGSWLIAIGILYGGASLLPKREPPPPTTPLPSSPEPMPGPDSTIPGLPIPGEPGPFPSGTNRLRQP
jgi:hypothetical protein